LRRRAIDSPAGDAYVTVLRAGIRVTHVCHVNSADPNRHDIVIVRASPDGRKKDGYGVFDYVDEVAFTNDQGARAQKLFAAVVLAALDDAIADDKKYGNGAEVIARWARSRDGREVLMCAGIDPNERTVKGMMDFVRRGVRTSVALSREESERQHARSEAA
jgi:hypothetical protein